MAKLKLNDEGFYQCANCDTYDFKVRQTSTKWDGVYNWSISCKCGMLTRLCRFVEELQYIWNMRDGKEFHIPKVTRGKELTAPISGVEFEEA